MENLVENENAKKLVGIDRAYFSDHEYINFIVV